MMALLNQIDEASSAVLVGTQMLAKGHYFPRLTLVVMLDVDGGLFSVDFRAQERLAQLICQVSGRSGRVDSCGEVMIQTYHPEHEFFQILLNHGYPAYVAKVLQERENLALPPVSFMALLSSESKRYEDSRSFLSEARRYLLDLRHGGLNVLGPVPAPLAKRRDLFRGQLLIQSHSRVVLQESIRPLVRGLSGHSCARKVRWSIDIDPLDLL